MKAVEEDTSNATFIYLAYFYSKESIRNAVTEPAWPQFDRGYSMYVFAKERLEDDFPKNRRNLYFDLDSWGYTSDSTAVDSYRCANVWHGTSIKILRHLQYDTRGYTGTDDSPIKGANKRHR